MPLWNSLLYLHLSLLDVLKSFLHYKYSFKTKLEMSRTSCSISISFQIQNTTVVEINNMNMISFQCSIILSCQVNFPIMNIISYFVYYWKWLLMFFCPRNSHKIPYFVKLKSEFSCVMSPLMKITDVDFYRTCIFK